MKHLREACLRALHQLEIALEDISLEDFSRPSPALGGSTIGQHARHTIEFFLCLERGLSSGVVNYDQRPHDRQMESDRVLALRAIRLIRKLVEKTTADKALVLEVCYDEQGAHVEKMATTYFRELANNLEHAVHHMAIIRIGIRDLADYIELPENFGIAVSTVRYQRAKALA